MIGNFRNVAQDLLNQHAEMVAVSYLNSLQETAELIEDNKKRKPLPFFHATRSGFESMGSNFGSAFHSRNWQRSSTLKRMKTEQLKQIQNIEDKIQTRDDLKKQIEA